MLPHFVGCHFVDDLVGPVSTYLSAPCSPMHFALRRFIVCRALEGAYPNSASWLSWTHCWRLRGVVPVREGVSSLTVPKSAMRPSENCFRNSKAPPAYPVPTL